MKYIVIYIFLILNFAAFSQWSSTVTLNTTNNYSFVIDKFCVVNENTAFTGGNKRETSSSPVTGVLYYTLNGGTSWDSLEFLNRYISALESPSSSVVYFISSELIYPPVGSPYYKKFIHRSIDSGQSWNESLIDSTSWGLMTKPLSFLNDSTGILKFGTSLYKITRDYGATWAPINLPIHKFSNTLGGDTLLLEVQNIYTVNLSTLDIVDSMYSANCIGSLQSYDKWGDILMRAYIAQDGPERGYPDNNYVSVTIDEYPLGNQRILHFPYLQTIVSVHLTSTNIYLLRGSIATSTDGGYSFYAQESTEPDAADLVFMNLDLANETIGYAVTRSSVDNTYKIQKTTNAGGVTSNYITPPLQFTAGINEPSKNTVSIYPNPASENLTITSTEMIHNIEIIDLFGRTILVLNDLNTLETNLDLSKYSNGNYIIKVSTNSNTEFYSWIKN